jgi:hypothetical protein
MAKAFVDTQICENEIIGYDLGSKRLWKEAKKGPRQNVKEIFLSFCTSRVVLD